jgi:hypothetical protein
VLIPLLLPLLGPPERDPLSTGRLVLVVGEGEPLDRALALLVSTDAADDDRARGDSVAVRAGRAAAPALGRNAFLVVDRAAGGAGFIGVVDRGAWVVGREWAADRDPSGIATADNRLVTPDGLLEDREVRATASAGCDADTTVVDNVDAHGAGRQHAPDKAALTVKPRLDRVVTIAIPQRLTTVVDDVPADHNLPVVSADDALAVRQRDQDCRHQPILINGLIEDNPSSQDVRSKTTPI